jgi:large subunit ribosomal protein L35
MPKLKTKSGAKKRFRLTATGKVRRNYACKNHMLRRRPQKMIRTARGTTIMSASDAKIVKRNFLPYAK